MGTMKTIDVDMFPSNLEFSVFTGEEIKRLSVVKIITGMTFDPLGHPLPGGLYDSQMGTFGKRMEPCTTCFNVQACPGHLGHIELNALVYNPFFIKLVQKICNVFCGKCHKIQAKEHETEILILQLRLIDAGFIVEAQELEMYKSEIVLNNVDTLVKLEKGDSVHPRIAKMYELLEKKVENKVNVTKTSCALRTAVVNAALQRPISKKCIHCEQPLRYIRYLHRKLVYYMSLAEIKEKFENIGEKSGQNKVIFADECRRFLRQVYENYPELMQLVFPILKINHNSNAGTISPIDIFFMDTIPVTPPKARPSNILFDQIVEHPQTGGYRNIIQNNSVLRVVLKHIKGQADQLSDEAKAVFSGVMGTSSYEKLYNAWQSLQTSIDVLLDVNLSRESVASVGLKQVLEKKEGLIRKHMMGKRVNYAARTVITPDPNINVDEVGIPDIFAKKLSYPVPVTPWNVAELRKMVMNGPNIHPGANYIQDERGYTTLIPADNATKRESMAKLLFNYPEKGIKIVHRHVLNGDVLLLNRQPSLHKPSIMAHRARILQGEKTFRLHYSNCKAYNADFDGDEMNAHLPQSEVARSEAYNLVNVANNYLVPKDGTPLGGLIQDHVISGVKLSLRGRFFNREDYHQLVFQGLSYAKKTIKLLPPTILKPIQLWSGKQILSTIIINLIPEGYSPISLKSIAKIGDKHWLVAKNRKASSNAGDTPLNESKMSESEVIIQNGELLVGVLDKQQYGATTYGLIHCMYELYGGEVSTCVLTAFTKVFTFFLQREGFTLGVKDILVTREADTERRKIIQESREIGNAALASALELETVPALDVLAEKMEEAYIKDPKFRVVLDRKYKNVLDNYTNGINKTCLPDGLITKFPTNNLQLMVLSGAKGSMVNTMQISCMLGQIELEGKRPPLMISGKSLPSFTSFETSPKSGGYIDGRFLTGIQPQDFFFHCMAGREGLIDTAVKTSRSGYLQRCLIKHLEGLTINYDLTVRDSDNTVVQYLYGEDGLDILKSKFFNCNFGTAFLTQNASVILHPQELSKIKNEEELLKVQRHNKKLRSWLKKRGSNSGVKNKHISPFTQFSAELNDEIEVEDPNEINQKTGRRRIDEAKIKLWYKTDSESKHLYQKKYTRCPDPTNAVFSQDTTYGSVSERIEKIVSDYMAKHPNRKEAVADVMYMKHVKALAAPGEPVGLIAAQSIGEPSTQMTLNTFHFAGRGEMNVTLGIPRLREILMMASVNIKTPSMDIPIIAGREKAAEKLRISLNRVTLADVLQYVNVKTQLVQKPTRCQKYELFFQFLPREAYSDNFCVKPKQILRFMSRKFFTVLFRAIIKTKKSKEEIITMSDKQKDDSNSDEKLDADEPEDDPDKKAKNSKSNASGNDNDSSDDEQANNDDGDDAAGIKLKSRKLDETEYDDPDDAEEQIDADSDEDLNDDSNNAALPNSEEDIVNEKSDATVEKVLDNAMVESYLYDKEAHLWAKLTINIDMKYNQPNMLSLIKDLAQKTIIHEVDKVKRAIIYEGSKGEQTLKTDGINIAEMFQHNTVVDINRLYTNDIHAIARTYGIEAAAQVVVREVKNVFKVYGITVDRRHLSLIADYMTFDGTFQPLSRRGMEHSSSPLQQMSFESCLQFLKNAAGAGYGDELNSPSSRLMVGLPVRNGTGAFELLSKIC